MITKNIQFKCITPCMCAGANQGIADIRPSAIRGALRWWFRALGGTSEQEIETFGGGKNVVASSIRIRVAELKPRPVGALPSPAPMTPLAYILYFASIAGGDNANFGQGPRWNPEAMLGTGTTFNLQLRQLREIPTNSLELLELAIKAFSHYGSIGLRTTRGMGAIQCTNATEASFSETDSMLESRGFTIRRSNKTHKVWDEALKEAGTWLKENLRGEFGAGGNKKPAKATALGSIKPVRQTSAVYLRPIELSGELIFSAFEAPHTRVLGQDSRNKHSEPVLKSRDFTQSPFSR